MWRRGMAACRLPEEWLQMVCYVAALLYEMGRLLCARLYKKSQRLTLALLRKGAVPRHLAFIMDGNRRFAIRQGLASQTVGHFHGFRKFEQILEWCFELGVDTITVYAFSVENFKRPKEEVDVLMQLAIDKFEQLSHKSEFVKKNQVAIRIVGELDLLPEAVRIAACNAMYATRDHSRFVVNVCFPYTARAEILNASNQLLKSAQKGELPARDINISHISDLMYTGAGPGVDIIIRTSGERRLSDFLTWQFTQQPVPSLEIVDALWPDFGLFTHLLPIILRYKARCSRGREQDGAKAAPSAQWTALLAAKEAQRWKAIKKTVQSTRVADSLQRPVAA